MKRLESVLWGLAVLIAVAIAGAWPLVGFFVALALIYANIVFGGARDQGQTGSGSEGKAGPRERGG